MIITVRVTLGIGQGNGLEEHLDIEVANNWREMTEDEREEVLAYEWKQWAWNFIDGGCSEIHLDK